MPSESSIDHRIRVCLLAAIGCLVIGATTASVAAAEPQRPLMAYVGTFSAAVPGQSGTGGGNGRGIHLFEVDRRSGSLSPAGIVRMGNSPSRLVVNATGTRLYSANESDRIGDGHHGSVSAFAIDRIDGQLQILGTVDAGGAGPTHLSIHPDGKHVFIANYFDGSISVIPIGPDGALAPPSDVERYEGKIGPRQATSAPPGSFAFSGHDRTHAHMIQSDAAGRFVLHADLGTDQIYVWKFDQQTGRLSPHDPPAVAVAPGDGPRHFAFHPNDRWLYSIQEEGSTIVLFDYQPAQGRLSQRQTISTLPPGYAGSNFCSEILVSGDGKFVYAGNRWHDSIGIFSVGDDGRLTFVDAEWTRGDYPRSFSFDPSGSFLYCGNQKADNVTTFRVDRQLGKLEFSGQYTPVGSPSHIVFVDLSN